MIKGRIVSDWSKVNFADPVSVRQMMGAFNHFMRQPDRDPQLRKAMQHFATKGDFPAEILQIIEKFHAAPNYDNGYEDIFDIRDYTGTNESGFQILDVTSGLAFDEILVGEKAKVYPFSGSKATISFAQYGGGLNWNRTLMDDRQYWLMEDTAIELRNKFYYKRATTFYALIDAITSGQNLAWQDQSLLVNNEALSDFATISKACENILTAVKDKGYGVTPNTPFVVLAPIQLRNRIFNALNALTNSQSAAPKAMQWNVVPRYTMMLTDATKFYVALPKVKSKGGYRQDLTLLYNEDILSYSDTVVGWGRWGGAIGDVEQFQRCATS